MLTMGLTECGAFLMAMREPCYGIHAHTVIMARAGNFGDFETGKTARKRRN